MGSEMCIRDRNEPGVVDAQNLQLLRYPPLLSDISEQELALEESAARLGFRLPDASGSLQPNVAGCGEDIEIGPAEAAVLVDDHGKITVV